MNFINGIEPGFQGAEGWGSDKPFYAYTSDGIIIVDLIGITYFDYEAENGEDNYFTNNIGISSYTEALKVVEALSTIPEEYLLTLIKATYHKEIA